MRYYPIVTDYGPFQGDIRQEAPKWIMAGWTVQYATDTQLLLTSGRKGSDGLTGSEHIVWAIATLLTFGVAAVFWFIRAITAGTVDSTYKQKILYVQDGRLLLHENPIQ